MAFCGGRGIYGYVVFFLPCKEKVHFYPVACSWVCSESVGWQCWEQGVGPAWERLCSEKGREEPGRLVATGSVGAFAFFKISICHRSS